MILSSPAKINLVLDLLYRRIDGFHEIDTVMCKIDLSDSIEIVPDNELKVICRDVPQESNLIYKAVKNLESVTGRKFLYRIEVNKNIPMGAGLAGGSSNAGTVIRYIGNDMGIDNELLFRAGAMTGSDVNFFVYQGNYARCLGRGEIIIPLSLSFRQEFVLCIPDIHSSTPDVYKNFDIFDRNAGNNVNSVLSRLFKGQKVENAGLFNVLEKPAFSLYNKISEYFEFIREFDKSVRMSGSGSSLFMFGPESEKLILKSGKNGYFLRKTAILEEKCG